MRPEPLEVMEREAQKIARTIDDMMPKGWGFCFLFVNHTDDVEKRRVSYISNINREDVPDMMRELLGRWDEPTI